MKKSRLIKKSTLNIAKTYIATPSRSKSVVGSKRYKNFDKSSKRTIEEKSIISEIRNTNKIINKRLINIKQTSKLSTFTDKISNEMKSYKGKNISQLSIRKLRVLRNRLKYVNKLKSTTKKGNNKNVKREDNYKKRLQNIIDKMTPDELKDKITRNDNGAVIDVANEILDKIENLYNKLCEEFGLWDKFKYEILEDMQTLVLCGYSDDEILQMMQDKLDILYEEHIQDSNNFEWTYF